MLMNEASVGDLSKRTAETASDRQWEIQRFRPNIVVTGPEAYDEVTIDFKRLEVRTADISYIMVVGRLADNSNWGICEVQKCAQLYSVTERLSACY